MSHKRISLYEKLAPNEIYTSSARKPPVDLTQEYDFQSYLSFRKPPE